MFTDVFQNSQNTNDFKTAAEIEIFQTILRTVAGLLLLLKSSQRLHVFDGTTHSNAARRSLRRTSRACIQASVLAGSSAGGSAATLLETWVGVRGRTAETRVSYDSCPGSMRVRRVNVKRDITHQHIFFRLRVTYAAHPLSPGRTKTIFAPNLYDMLLQIQHTV